MSVPKELDHQIDYWNRIGTTKAFSHPVNVGCLKQLLAPDARILDFGCGYGRALGVLQSQGFSNLIGVDPAPAMIAAARQQFPTIDFQELEDSPYLPLPDASIDAALLFSVLTCVPSDDGQLAILRETGRVLRSGGLLYISDLWLQTDPRNVQRYQRDKTKYGLYGVFDLPEGVTVRHHDRHWIERLTQDYELLKLDEIEVTTMNGHPARGFQWFGRKADLSAIIAKQGNVRIKPS